METDECAGGCGYRPTGRKPEGWQCGKCDPERMTEYGTSQLPYRYEVLMRFTVVGDGLHADGNGAMATVHKIAAAIESADIPNVTDVSAFPASIVYLGKTDRLRIWPSDSPHKVDVEASDPPIKDPSSDRVYEWLIDHDDGSYSVDMNNTTPAEMDRRLIIAQELRAGRLVLADSKR